MMSSMIHRTLNILGSTLHYWIHNPKGAETIIAVHGFRGNHKALIEFADFIPDSRVILFDLPGYGESTELDGFHTIPQYAATLHALVQALGLTDFHLWGHSFGGSVCIDYAATYPEHISDLTLVSPAVVTDGLLEKLGAGYYKIATKLPEKAQYSLIANKLIDRLSAEVLIKNVSPERKRAMIQSGKENLKEAKPNVLVESYLSFYHLNFFELAHIITLPVYIIAGKLDTIVGLNELEKISKAFSHASLTVIEDHGHLTPLEIPEKIALLSREFMGLTETVTSQTQSLEFHESHSL